jgi:hypothetical protein
LDERLSRWQAPDWCAACIPLTALDLTAVYNRVQEATSHLTDDHSEDEPAQTLNLVDQYIALLLAVYLEAGLLEALVTLIEDVHGTLGRKATLLIGEILQLANRVLPLQYAAQIQVCGHPDSLIELIFRHFLDFSAERQTLPARMNDMWRSRHCLRLTA